jgi:protein phosphatase 1 regulatory subunit 7
VQLEQLYLSHNGIVKIEGLGQLTKLQTLDLGHNQIEHLENIEGLVSVEEFWVCNASLLLLRVNHLLWSQCGGNKLESWRELELLRHLPAVSCVYLEFNPLASEPAYRRKLKLLLPSLKQIDAVMCV